MRITVYVFLGLLFCFPFVGRTQFNSGFNKEEARLLIQVCNSFTYLDLYQDDAAILPEGYEKVYTSPSLGMDNKFQVYRNVSAKKAAINFRGTTGNQMSWMANLYASMIDVQGTIQVDGVDFNYQLGENKDSRVHAGYTLAIYYFKDALLAQIQKLNAAGIYDIYITGHSQGGALAHLVRAYLNYLREDELDAKNSFKVYAFANPMVGNKSFVEEYHHLFESKGMSFTLHNPEDIVPKLPYSETDSVFWKEHLVTFLTNRDEFSTRNFMIEAMTSLMGNRIIDMAKNMSKRIEKQLFSQLGNIQMPPLYDDFNYKHTANVMQVSPTVYPLILKDSTILENDSLMQTLPRDKDGNFQDKRLYKSENFWLQHKPYNYYTAILKDYFPKDYQSLDRKVFIDPRK